MGNKSTTAKVTHKDGELTVQQHEIDSPILPVAQLEHLHTFKPDAVDWVITQTQAEAEFRRSENKRINTLVFIQQLVGQIFALLIGLAGIGAGGYVAANGQPKAGAIIAVTAITGLAAVFLTGRVKKP